MGDTSNRRVRIAVASIAVVFAVVALSALSGAAAADHATESDDRIQIVDAFNLTEDDPVAGNTTVAVEATTDETVDGVQFWYNGSGPLNLSEGGILSAEYDNGTEYTEGDGFSADSGDRGIVFFDLNESWSDGQFELNASAYGTDYASAESTNRSVLTGNAYGVTLQNATGDPIQSQVPMLVSNASSEVVRGDALAGANHAFHCGGVVVGGSCEDPDTDGETHAYSRRGSTQGNALYSFSADLQAQAFQFETANGTQARELTAGGTETLQFDEPTSPLSYNVTAYNRTPLLDSVDEVSIENHTSGQTIYRFDPDRSPPIPLAFLSPKTQYEVEISGGGETYRRFVTEPTKGIAQRVFRLPAFSSPDTSEVVGQVTNESGASVAGATVSAEPIGAATPEPYNSTITNENGLFSMTLPESRDVKHRYQFRLVSNQTENGTIAYFPTRADNGGTGYEVRESRTILPRLELRDGAEVDVDVANASGGALPNQGLSSLSRTTTRTFDRTRTSVAESFALFSFPQVSTTNATLRLPSPQTGTESNVTYNVWGIGMNENVTDVCAQQIEVNQGERAESACGLEDGGTLDIELQRYGSVIDQDTLIDNELVGNSGYYFRNALLVRNATSGNVTTYLGPGSVQPYFAEDGEPSTLSLPVPPGNYTVELRPTQPWVDRTAVRNSTTVEVGANERAAVELAGSGDFSVTPMPRTNSTFRRGTDNTVAFEVREPGTGDQLDDNDVDVSLRLFHRNGTLASDGAEQLTHSGSSVFDSTTYQPGVPAGAYRAEVRVTHQDGDSRYNTTFEAPIRVSDFTAQIRTEQQTVQPGGTVLAGMRAYDLTADPPEALDANAEDIQLTLYDREGNALDRTTLDQLISKKQLNGNTISNGEGTFELPVPDVTGVYRIEAFIETTDGQQAIDDTWIRASSYGLDVSLNRSVYAPTDVVGATVEVTNESGDPVNATIETTVGQESVTNSTSGDPAMATVRLDPGALFDDGAWDGPTFMEVEATVATGEGLKTVRGGTGINVRAFQADASAARGQYGVGEDPAINVFVPPSADVDATNVTAVERNGESIEKNATEVESGFYRIDLDGSQLDAGGYDVVVEATNDAGRTATDRARFRIASADISLETDARRYNASETIDITATVRAPNGTRLDGEPVELSLFEAGENPIRANRTTNSTDSDGEASAQFTPASTGVHAVVASVGGDEAVMPVLVTNLDTTITDGDGSEVESYTFEPGADGTIHVEVSDGSPVDGAKVGVRALVGGELVELGTNETTNGETSIEFGVPESVNTGSYPFEALVRTPNGAVDRAVGRIQIESEESLSLDVEAAETVYSAGESAEIRADLAEGDDPASDRDVEFVLQSRSSERTLGTATTDEGGVATITESIPSDLTSGEYRVRARVADTSVTAYDGVLLSDVEVSIDTDAPAYAAGETMTLNVSATNRTSGDPVIADEGGVRIRLSDGDEVTTAFNRSATGPYEIDVDIPDDSAAVGSRTVEAFVRNGSSADIASTSVDVRSPTENATLEVPDGIVAGENVQVNATATVDSEAEFAVFSPGTGSVVHDETLTLNATPELSLPSPGTYVFRLSVPGVGTRTEVRHVAGDEADPTLSVGPDLSTNATTFDTGEEIYIRTDAEGLTATILSPDDESTVSLDETSGGTYYGTTTIDEAGPYLVRLDGRNATDIDSTILEVSDE